MYQPAQTGAGSPDGMITAPCPTGGFQHHPAGDHRKIKGASRSPGIYFLLLIGSGHAFIPEVDNDTCVNLFVCALSSPTNLYEFDHDKNFLLVVDTNGCNIAEEQRNRSTITKLGDYECATIKNLQESDAGVYDLRIAKEDGISHLKKTFRLTTDDLNNLRNASHLNTNGSNSFHGLPILTYLSTPETELREALRRSPGNGTKPDFILAVLVTSQNRATEESMNVTTPTGTALPPKDGRGVRIVTILACLGIPAIALIALLWKRNCCTRTPAMPEVPQNRPNAVI